MSGSGTTTRTVTLSTISGNGTLAISLAANTAQDAAGNRAAVSGPSASVTVDNTAPIVTLTTPAAITTTNQSAYPVSGTCTSGDGNVTVSVGTVSGSAACSGGTFSTTLHVSGLTDGTGIAVNARQTDAAGNTGSASAAISKDTVAPTVTLTSAASDPTNASSIPVTVTFSESVTGFVAADLVVVNATVSAFSGSGALYTFTLTPLAAGSVTVDIAANVATDAVGNGNTVATQLRRTVTRSAPLTRVYLPLISLPAPLTGPDLVVETLTTTNGLLTLTIANTGDTAVTTPFWVDVLIAPSRAPVAANDTWDALGTRGLTWGVTTPLAPGARLTLTVGDSFYRADYSQPGGPIAVGTLLYAHVDAVNTQSAYGGVNERHEILGLPYNNVFGPVSATTEVVTPNGSAATAAPTGLPARR